MVAGHLANRQPRHHARRIGGTTPDDCRTPTGKLRLRSRWLNNSSLVDGGGTATKLGCSLTPK
jgi:hypothetical protein